MLSSFQNLHLINSPNRDHSSSGLYVSQSKQLLDTRHPQGRARLAVLEATKLSRMLHKRFETRYEDQSSFEEVFEIIQNIQTLDMDFAAWCDGAEADWKCRSILLNRNPQDQATQMDLDPLVYTDPLKMAQHGLVRSARLSLLDEVLDWILFFRAAEEPALDPKVLEGLQWFCVQTSQKTINDIIASIPFALGDVDAAGALNSRRLKRAVGPYLLMASLANVFKYKSSTELQKDQTKDALWKIGNVWGIRHALRLLEDRTPPPTWSELIRKWRDDL